MEMGIFKKPYWSPNKESKRLFKDEAKRLIGYDQSVNPTWAKTWKYFIKRQFPWYGLLELNQFKIIEMRDYMQHHSHYEKDVTEKQIKQMTEVIELGNKILEDKYNYYEHAWLAANQVDVLEVYEKIGEETTDCGQFGKVTIDKSGKLLTKLYNVSIFDDLIVQDGWKEDLNDDISSKVEYLKDKNVTRLKDWLSENNLTRKDVAIQQTGEWTNGISEEENQKHLKILMLRASKERKEDINKYFKLIAKYYDNWGD